MKRSDVSELHYITPLRNIPSILKHGILSHHLARRFGPTSVANASVQNVRAGLRLSTGRRLHEHANLYFHARNPMMYAIKEQHQDLVVLRVHPDVLDLEGVVIADGNAARSETAFWTLMGGLARIDRDQVFAHDWNAPNPQVKHENVRVKCAEALVPDRVPSEFITGAYVSCATTKEAIELTGVSLIATIDEQMFFLRRRW